MPELLDWLTAHDNNFRPSRLASLYSDFQRQKAVNPDGYKANIQTWQAGLRKGVRAQALLGEPSVLSIRTGPKLLESLTSREYGTPSALGAVIQESLSDGSIIPLDTFVRADSSIYRKSWIPSASAVALWALDHLGLAALMRGPASQARYAIIGNLEEASARLGIFLDQHKGRLDCLIPMEIFRREAAQALDLGDGMSEVDLSLLLVFLSRDKKRISYNKDLVKVLPNGEAGHAITNQDTELVSLKALQVRLTEQEAALTEKVQGLAEKAKTCVAEKNRVGALRALRSKKTCEAVLERRSVTLAQVDATLSKIEEAADQVDIIKAMEGSSSVLKSLMAETGGRENVERIVDQLQEEMEKVDDLGAIMQEAGPGALVVDETEIDDELKTLQDESQQQENKAKVEETKQMLKDIPSIPAQEQTSADQDLSSSIDALNRMSLDQPAGSDPKDTEQSKDYRTAINAT